MRQIIVNLVGNAIKFTDQGEIIVEVVPEAAEDGIRLRFSVQDTGVGIPSDKQHLVFDAFTQADTSTSRRHGGTGLGLSISSRLVHLMDGQIWLESEPDEGTTVFFTAGFESASAPLPAPVRSADPLRGESILVVDDNATTRLVLDEMLRHWEMEPTLVADGPTALAELARAAHSATPYRCVLLDCVMPGMNGFEVTDRAHRAGSLLGTRILMITSAGGADHLQRCRELSITRCLTKPVLESELADALLDAIAPAEPTACPAGSNGEDAASRGLKILVAEDGAINQRVARGMLEQLGHRVTLAANGRDALGAVGRERFDLVLMDVHMPELDGYEATATIRASEDPQIRDLPVIALTADAMRDDRQRCLAAGMDEYLAKPLKLDELRCVLAHFADGRRAGPLAPPERTSAVAGFPGEAEAAATSDGDGLEANRIDRPVIDWPAARRQIPGDETTFQDLLGALEEECRGSVEAIRRGLAAGDCKAVRTAAHTLKSTSELFAAERVFSTALQMERMAAQEDLNRTEAMLPALESEIAELAKAIAESCGDGESQAWQLS